MEATEKLRKLPSLSSYLFKGPPKLSDMQVETLITSLSCISMLISLTGIFGKAYNNLTVYLLNLQGSDIPHNPSSSLHTNLFLA